MARTDDRFRLAYQDLLTVIAKAEIGSDLPPELTLAEQLNISRTTVRAVLTAFADIGLIAWEGRKKTILRAPSGQDKLAMRDEYLPRDELERRFLQWVLRFDVPAGTPLNVAKLAKEFSVPPHVLQEFLSGLSQFGLVARRPRGGWLLLGFTAEYAIELSEFRAVLELNAVRVLVALPPGHPIWAQLTALEAQHIDLAARIDRDFHAFSPLDEAFHSAITSVVQNRFVKQFQKVITLIFHYHYQWDKRMERDRNAAAIGEHLAIIHALRSGDEAAAVQAAAAHLRTSKETLLASLRGNALIAPE
ncbi:FCD domain-containing protein [Pseudorhodobacter sp. E13]|uniref:GntR family transcriptional regulator n=1 Tax=Pseudorhodobacter sp. E13 TaxID=2487931 RepID=UPI000F8E58FE|nr:FCD domain-containing protein [Pseudorhodobacter sp. E13]RUS60809.1 FCD domain-containing protein [Pseudorhodobacter sp. E13]